MEQLGEIYFSSFMKRIYFMSHVNERKHLGRNSLRKVQFEI